MFSQTLVKLRNLSNMNQEQVASYLGITRVTYSRLETGKTSPSLEQVEKLSAIFGVSTETLIYGITDPADEIIETVTFKDEEEIIPREVPQENLEKLREVLLYVLDRVAGKSNVGETVLYKLLYFIDFDFYEKTGKSITGITYVRNHYGPTPKIKTFNAVINQMKKMQELDVVETPGFNAMQRKYLPRVAPRLEELNASELDHINEVINRLGDKTATELSAYSHKDTPWIATKHLQAIDYQFAKYRTSETSVKEPEDDL